MATMPAAQQTLRSPAAAFEELPLLYEDDQEFDMGESNPHVMTDEILHLGLRAHFRRRRDYQAFSNMNLYYPARAEEPPYVSPDDMVVRPFRRLPHNTRSYEIGVDGPSPVLTAEVLSERSAQQSDLDMKIVLYSRLKVSEYVIIDPEGDFAKYLPGRLVLKRLNASGMYEDAIDDDGGVTSQLGFRLIIEKDGLLRVANAKTGRPYTRPDDADEETRLLKKELERQKREYEQRLRMMEGKLSRLERKAKKK